MEGGEERSNVTRSGAFGRRSRTKAQASQPWIHVAFARVEHGLPLADLRKQIQEAFVPLADFLPEIQDAFPP